MRMPCHSVSRRSVLAGAVAALGWSAFTQADSHAPGQTDQEKDAPIKPKDPLKIGHDWKNRELYDEDDGSVVDW